MAERVFFYGTLMAGFDRRRRAGIDTLTDYLGRGWIQAQLYDLGIYPAAVPAPEGRVWGEVHSMKDRARVLKTLDEIEGYRPEDLETSLYVRKEVPVTLEDGRVEQAWAYFYNAPLGRAERIDSGDYLEYLKVK
jgi:gamma-glutamylcyclotransferase (GGCT)/AIG2-like uncharacterized protein YtfP